MAEVRRRADLFPGVDPRDLDAWAETLRRDPDLHLPRDASLAPYLREALRRLQDGLAAQPGWPGKSRLTFVRRTAFGLVNDDKPNRWASGRTDGREGVCATAMKPRQSSRGGRVDASDVDAAALVADMLPPPPPPAPRSPPGSLAEALARNRLKLAAGGGT